MSLKLLPRKTIHPTKGPRNTSLSIKTGSHYAVQRGGFNIDCHVVPPHQSNTTSPLPPIPSTVHVQTRGKATPHLYSFQFIALSLVSMIKSKRGFSLCVSQEGPGESPLRNPSRAKIGGNFRKLPYLDTQNYVLVKQAKI